MAHKYECDRCHQTKRCTMVGCSGLGCIKTCAPCFRGETRALALSCFGCNRKLDVLIATIRTGNGEMVLPDGAVVDVLDNPAKGESIKLRFYCGICEKCRRTPTS